MAIRFFILQSHYRSTLDFGNEALQASEKALKRLWEAYENLQKLSLGNGDLAGDAELDKKVQNLLAEFDEFMNDDLNTAKVIANMFELTPIINGIKGGQVAANALSSEIRLLLLGKMKTWLEDIFGLQPMQAAAADNKLQGVMEVLIELRREARARKDYQTSDKIRNRLSEMGVLLKDEKDGSVSWSVG
jgi:cysteinyl-tRNA synthetase